MDLPARVVVFCPTLGLKNKPGRLMTVSPQGYYEIRLDLPDGNHTTLLPVAGTVIVFAEPNVTGEPIPELER